MKVPLKTDHRPWKEIESEKSSYWWTIAVEGLTRRWRWDHYLYLLRKFPSELIIVNGKNNYWWTIAVEVLTRRWRWDHCLYLLRKFPSKLVQAGKAKRTTIDGLLLLKVSPEDEGWVLPGLGGVHLVGPVVLRDRDLHELEHKELNWIDKFISKIWTVPLR